MTGLDLEVDELVEIAVVITDYELNPVDAGLSIVIKPDASALERWAISFATMHTESGLIEEIPNGVQRRRGRVRSARVRAEARPRRAEGATRRQHHRHRSCVPHEVHAAPRRATCTTATSTSPRSRSSRGAGIRARTSTPRRRTADTERSPTSSSPSASSHYYRRAVFVPEPGPSSHDLQALAAAVVHEFDPEGVVVSLSCPIASAIGTWWV